MRAKHESEPLFVESLLASEAASNSRADPNHAALLARFLHLTEVALPAMARERRWPIRFDHCFKRICLDHAFSAPWYQHLPRPAVRHLRGEALASAVRCAAELHDGDASLLARRNADSLRWRGKRARTEAR